MRPLRQLFPWWLKIFIKIVLSRLPVNYQQWKKLKIFKHGDADDVWSPAKKFLLHYNAICPEYTPRDYCCLELGPGDSVASGIIAKCFGASRTYLVDVGRYATEDLDYYKRFCRELEKNKTSAPDLSKIVSFEELLEVCNIEYLTDGIVSLRQIPAKSVDFIWSHSVLEHIRRHLFAEVASEFHRIRGCK